MSGTSSVSNSLLSSLISSLGSSGPATSTSAASGPDSTASDIVSLLSGAASGSDRSIYSILDGASGSTSADSMYDVLLSAESAAVMKASPALADKIIAGEQASAATSSSGSSSTESLVSELENINLLTVSPDSLMSMLEKSASGSAPTINTTA